ncbi:MAG: Nucleotidyltransferase [Candidatus Saganbacteria bacterium]|uniref:Nucleotidyltransferase n=1 Tax=Candidatus Saganbacteria bacterium TaxID=2575572 RepID=A0A833L0Z0_UNCSA|nr:MAG: Nucleotidyltransferase [Candidatus Saganbacteria bacterium]
MRDDRVYLKHITEAIDKVKRYISGNSFESFCNNDMLLDAVVRELEIIGEAANNISKEFQEKNPELPWILIIGMRNRLIHEYFGVNKKIVWETCQTDLKQLEKLLLPLI